MNEECLLNEDIWLLPNVKSFLRLLEVVVPPRRTRLFMGNKQVLSIKTWINLALCCNNTEGDCPRLAGITKWGII